MIDHHKHRKKRKSHDKIKNFNDTMVRKAIKIIKKNAKKLKHSICSSDQMNAIIQILLAGLFMLVAVILKKVYTVIFYDKRSSITKFIIVFCLVLFINPNIWENPIQTFDSICVGIISDAVCDLIN